MKKERFLAFIIDAIIVTLFTILIYNILLYYHVKIITPMVCIIGWAILICKDCFNGVSIGKRIMGIQIVDIQTHQIASPQKCVIRNLFYFLSFIDVIVMFANSKNLRLGDLATHTKVTSLDSSLSKTKLSKAMFSIGIVFICLVIMEVIYYFRAASFGLL